jgi:hypothetical protein
MFRWLESRILWGALLILAGVVFLLQNLGFFRGGDIFWAFVLGFGGIFFLSAFFPNRANWWALIPGFTLLSIALLILLEQFVPRFTQTWGGSIVLGGIAISFFAVYLVNRDNWWAVIPGGVIFTLAIVAGLDTILSGFGGGGIFFIGMGLTFALLAVLQTPQGQMKWAWIPAGVLLLMGLLITAAAEAWIGVIWPIALILVGLFFIYRTFVGRRG